MNVLYDSSFLKSIEKLKNPSIKEKVLLFIYDAKQAKSLQDLSSVKKIKGFKTFYRHRIGQYRLGFEVKDSITIILIVVAKRSDIYKRFP